MAFNPTYSTVENEGCELHFWYQGTGPLLIFVPGGSGHGRQYNKILPLLSHRFTAATYDRRGMSASKVAEPALLNPAQSARDIIAITKALGHAKTSIFANSGGGIISLQLAASYPEALDHLILHEVPTTSLLPDATFHLDHCFNVLETFRKEGPRAALVKFLSQTVGIVPGEASQAESENLIHWLANEFLVMTIYCPDLRKVVNNKVSVAVMAEEGSGEAFYVRTTVEQADILQCSRVVVPGNHSGFKLEAEKFAPILLETLDSSEKKRKVILAL